MERTIAVEAGLTPVREILKRKGYQVVDLNSGVVVDAAVISGMDENVMDMQDMQIDAPVINASGITPEAVLREVENKMMH
ncbi:MAG: YkuS family protein [Dethiobacter sp.]|jgi:hypothetical protein|nr:YkuS family protein [Dethiobacter sp.]